MSALFLITIVLIVGQLIDWRNRWSPTPPERLSAQVSISAGGSRSASTTTRTARP